MYWYQPESNEHLEVVCESNHRRVSLLKTEDISDVSVIIEFANASKGVVSGRICLNFHIEPWARTFAESVAKNVNGFYGDIEHDDGYTKFNFMTGFS